jgi:hypothetical protein
VKHYRGKGEHSVNSLEDIVEDQSKEILHLKLSNQMFRDILLHIQNLAACRSEDLSDDLDFIWETANNALKKQGVL